MTTVFLTRTRSWRHAGGRTKNVAARLSPNGSCSCAGCSMTDANARDAAVAASLAVQLGCPLEVLQRQLAARFERLCVNTARSRPYRGATMSVENYDFSDCAHFPPPTTVDLLTDAIEHVRPMLADESRPTKQRIRILWAAAKKTCDLGASDVVKVACMALAVETNLIDTNDRWTGADVRESVRRFGAEDVAHAITWALRGWNPFEKGPLK